MRVAAAADTAEVSPQRRALGEALRRLREAAGLNQRELARRTGWQQPKVSRLENGHTVPSDDDIAAWVRVVGADESAQTELANLAEQITTEAIAWKTLHRHGYGRNQQAIEE